MHEPTPLLSGGKSPVIGLALGGGGARGWAHLGVLRALGREGIEPDVIAGCSIGAFVGAALAAGFLEKLTDWASALKWQHVVSFLDVSLRGGLIKGEKIVRFFERNFADRDFSQLDRPFACVATELETGREIWLRDGSVSAAVRASIAIPGVFTPIVHQGRLLVDGGLVNPVPVSLCRAMGADVVIAVDLGSDMVGRTWRQPTVDDEATAGWTDRLLQRFAIFGNGAAGSGQTAVTQPTLPSLLAVMTTSINIMQVRIARSRLAGEPADVLLSPRLGHLGPMDYHRAEEAILEGEAAVERMLSALRHSLGRA